MTELGMLDKISENFGYKYKVHNGNEVVMEDFLGVDHNPTLEILGKDYCGHLEYKSIKDVIIDFCDLISAWKNRMPDLYEAVNRLSIGGSAE